jgi:choline dehydrogenase-like flavoprotein
VPTTKAKTLQVYLSTLLGLHLTMLLLCVAYMLFRPGPAGFAVAAAFTATCVVICGRMLLYWYALADLQKSTLLVRLLSWGSILAFLSSACFIAGWRTNGVVSIAGISLPMSLLFTKVAAVSLLDAVLTIILLNRAEREWLGLSYFSPLQYRTLRALAEVIIYGEHEIITGHDVAHNVDTYFKSFEAKSKWTMAWVVTALYFFPLLSLKPPLPYIASGKRRDFLKRRFYRDVETRRIPDFWRVLVQGLIRIAKQMCYIGYYNDARTFASVGYVPFSARKDAAERLRATKARLPRPLSVKSEADVRTDTLEGDVVIIGSGAGAAILARGLAEKGRKVLMIERGNHERPETFTSNEMEMVSRLFQDGALQAARDFRFTVFQGSCVGGSTVVNNAVCFKMPEQVLDRWNDPNGLNVGLDKREVMASMDRVWQMIGVEHMSEKTVRLNPGGTKFVEGCRKLGYGTVPTVVDSVNANISACAGCGYCNIGCAYDRKLSMLVTILPGIQAEYGADALEIVAGCEAVKLVRSGRRIRSVECEFRSGRRISVRGKTFVVAAGAISSSVLLLKSKLGIRNAGLNLSFNIGSQITAAFPQKIDSYDGLQISHFLKISPDTGFVMESWFNPPMFQSTAMPGWFEDHYRNMKRYDRLACVGILAGSESNARARIGGLLGREIDYTPTNKDFQTLLTGLELSGEIMLAAGAESVMPNTFKYYEFRDVKELGKLKQLISDPSEITLGTGHPQGGNVIGSRSEDGVVNPEFRVFDYDNLFVTDASVFPTSLGVNPQLTVMGLADYAVRFVHENSI